MRKDPTCCGLCRVSTMPTTHAVGRRPVAAARCTRLATTERWAAPMGKSVGAEPVPAASSVASVASVASAVAARKPSAETSTARHSSGGDGSAEAAPTAPAPTPLAGAAAPAALAPAAAPSCWPSASSAIASIAASMSAVLAALPCAASDDSTAAAASISPASDMPPTAPPPSTSRAAPAARPPSSIQLVSGSRRSATTSPSSARFAACSDGSTTCARCQQHASRSALCSTHIKRQAGNHAVRLRARLGVESHARHHQLAALLAVRARATDEQCHLLQRQKDGSVGQIISARIRASQRSGRASPNDRRRTAPHPRDTRARQMAERGATASASSRALRARLPRMGKSEGVRHAHAACARAWRTLSQNGPARLRARARCPAGAPGSRTGA